MLAKEQRFIERFRTHAAKAAQVQSRIKALDKIEKIELPKTRQVVKFEFRVPPRSGDQVAVIEDLHKSYGPRVIYDGFNLTIRRGERWAVMGRNGAGKTTLLKMIAGASAPDSGSVRLGASLNMGYFAQQSLDVLDPDLTIIEQLQKDFPQDGLGSLRTLAGAFQFSGDDVDKKIRALSGGEKSRLAMARMLYNPPNFLVLDEPTNHLDLATKEMLVDALKDFEGTMIFVSHDRMFLRGLGSRVLELGGESGTDRDPRGLSRLVHRVRAAAGPRSARHLLLTCACSCRCSPCSLPAARRRPLLCAKVAADPVTEDWYAPVTAQLAAMNREAEGLLRAGKSDQAAAVITKGQALANRLAGGAASYAGRDGGGVRPRSVVRRHAAWE